MKVAMLSPISWRTPPRHYGPWETVVSLLTEELVSMGVDVTLFASGDSVTRAKLSWVSKHAYSEDSEIDPKAWEGLHIAELFEHAEEFDLIHNHYDFLPLSYCQLTNKPVLTTIHGFSSPAIIPVYKKYNACSYYVAVSAANKLKELDYIATIHHGIDLQQFQFTKSKRDYLLFFGRIHPEKGTHLAIQVARKTGLNLIIAGIIHDQQYFDEQVKPHVDGSNVKYLGSVKQPDKSNLLGNALALLHLIDYDEAFALSLIESMACGTPVIAFNRGSVPEIIQHQKTGFIVETIDEACEAVNLLSTIDYKLCRQRVESLFSCEGMAKKYLELYENILEQRENYRPWGHYENLYERKDHKIKELVIGPGERLSLQKHRHRAEHWLVVSGIAIVTVAEKHLTLRTGMSVDIPIGTVHRIKNPGDRPLILVEVQMGNYFGEDDIIRLEDDYDRISLNE